MKRCEQCGQQIRPLSRRQVEVVELLVTSSLSNREIAERLGIAARTVKSYLHALFDRFGLAGEGQITHQRVRLAYFWHCELFQIGLRESGLIE